MAEDEDDSQKTEDPSARKLQKARDKGQTASSQEIKSWLILVGGTIGLILMAPSIMSGVRDMGYPFIQQPHAIQTDLFNLRRLMADLSLEALWILTPLLLLLIVLALFANLAQSGLIWAPSKIQPDFSKLNVLKGLKQKLSSRSLVEFAKGILKLVIVGTISVAMVLPLLDDVTLLSSFEIGQTLERMHDVAILIASATVAVMTVIALVDYAYQKFMHTKQMRMTKQEVKDEHKDTEGDPQIKARIRQLRMQRARQRMMAEVPGADVVVTNPTHFAVALKYDMSSMPAPVLVAKGQDLVAMRIRGVAEENEVPIVENPPLARALYASVDLNEEIPAEHYKAVAEVIGYVMRLKGKMPNH